mgnify:FL=1
MLNFGKPYFLENKEWYYHDDKINKFFLTDKAPEEARKSYEEFYQYHYDAFDYAILLEAKQSKYDDLIKEGKTPQEAQKICDDWWKLITGT